MNLQIKIPFNYIKVATQGAGEIAIRTYTVAED